jgi:hypothetical protein
MEAMSVRRGPAKEVDRGQAIEDEQISAQESTYAQVEVEIALVPSTAPIRQ